MGKQINYYMDYDSFLLVAQKAIDLGCMIVKEDSALGKVVESDDVSIVTKDCVRYYFHLLQAGDIEVEIVSNKEYLKRFACDSGNSIIEAGYSFIADEPNKKEIRRNRIYCVTGYYNDEGEYIPRPECLTKVYDSLVRYIKKVAPSTELTDIRISVKDEDYGKKYEYTHKEYISETCLRLINTEGYKLHH